MIDDITNAKISVYMNDGDTDQAVILNGGWAHGKTYYLKHSLIPSLVEEHKKNVVYLSMFGVKDVENIYTDILMQIASFEMDDFSANSYKNLTGKEYGKEKRIRQNSSGGFMKTATEIFGLSSKTKKLQSFANAVCKETFDFSKYIYVFDDFERISDGVNIEGVLGLFDLLANQNKAKVIVVCNEEKIQGKNRDAHLLFKEKIASMTIDFQSDFNAITQSVIDSFPDSESKEFYKSNLKIVLKAFSQMNSKNIRTLKFTISRFSELFAKIKTEFDKLDIDIDYFTDFIYVILVDVVYVSICIKEKGIPNDFFDAKELFRYFTFGKDGLEQKENPTYWDPDSTIKCYSFVFEYLNTYLYQEEEIEKAINNYIYQCKNDLTKAKSILEGIYYLEDEDAINKLQIVIADIEQDTYNVNAYPNFMDLFITVMERLKFQEIPRIEELIFRNAARRINEFDSYSWSTFPYNCDTAIKLRDKLFDHIVDLKKASEEKRLDEIFDLEDFACMFKEYTNSIADRWKENGRFLSKVSIEKAIDRLFKLSVRDLYEFRFGLLRVYNTDLRDLYKYYGQDKDYLKKLQIAIKEKMEGATDIGGMKTLALEYICGDIDRICEVLARK